MLSAECAVKNKHFPCWRAVSRNRWTSPNNQCINTVMGWAYIRPQDSHSQI